MRCITSVAARTCSVSSPGGPRKRQSPWPRWSGRPSCWWSCRQPHTQSRARAARRGTAGGAADPSDGSHSWAPHSAPCLEWDKYLLYLGVYIFRIWCILKKGSVADPDGFESDPRFSESKPGSWPESKSTVADPYCFDSDPDPNFLFCTTLSKNVEPPKKTLKWYWYRKYLKPRYLFVQSIMTTNNWNSFFYTKPIALPSQLWRNSLELDMLVPLSRSTCYFYPVGLVLRSLKLG